VQTTFQQEPRHGRIFSTQHHRAKFEKPGIYAASATSTDAVPDLDPGLKIRS
jgi:hypothetical protein